MLLFLENKDLPGVEVALPDGRGGDGGVDVGLLRGGEYFHIFQLKFFPQGFATYRSSTRKRQIRESFETAVTKGQALKEWTLVMPSKFTQGELTFLRQLGQGRSLRVRSMGPREMDALLARHPQLIDLMNRAPILEALEELRAADAALVTPADLRRKVAALGNRSDARSLHWATDFRYENSSVVEELRAKHPRAHEFEPLSIRFQTSESLPEETLKALRKHLDYGSERRVEIPVRSYEQMGPDWFAEKTYGGEVVVERPSLAPEDLIPISVYAIDQYGSTVGSFSGQITDIGRGKVGVYVSAIFFGVVTLKMELPYDRGSTGNVGLTFEYTAKPVSDVSRGRALVQELEAGTRARFEFGPSSFDMATAESAGPDFGTEFEEMVDDLLVIWKETGVDFPFPASLTNMERVYVRICSMVLSGRVPLLPEGATIPIELDNTQELPVPPIPIVARFPRQVMQVLGHRIDLGPVTIYCPSAEWTLHDSSSAKRKGNVSPVDGVGMRIFREASQSERVTAEPWNLSAIPEHREIR